MVFYLNKINEKSMKRKKYIVSMIMAAWAGISSAADYTNMILVKLEEVG